MIERFYANNRIISKSIDAAIHVGDVEPEGMNEVLISYDTTSEIRFFCVH